VKKTVFISILLFVCLISAFCSEFSGGVIFSYEPSDMNLFEGDTTITEKTLTSVLHFLLYFPRTLKLSTTSYFMTSAKKILT